MNEAWSDHPVRDEVNIRNMATPGSAGYGKVWSSAGGQSGTSSGEQEYSDFGRSWNAPSMDRYVEMPDEYPSSRPSSSIMWTVIKLSGLFVFLTVSLWVLTVIYLLAHKAGAI